MHVAYSHVDAFAEARRHGILDDEYAKILDVHLFPEMPARPEQVPGDGHDARPDSGSDGCAAWFADAQVLPGGVGIGGDGGQDALAKGIVLFDRMYVCKDIRCVNTEDQSKKRENTFHSAVLRLEELRGVIFK